MSKTPIEHRKLRNACFSGHFPGEEKRCPLCQEARFNTLVSGYHGDEPDQADIDRYLSNVETNNAEDRAFVAGWLDSKKSAKAFANVFNAFVELGKPIEYKDFGEPLIVIDSMADLVDRQQAKLAKLNVGDIPGKVSLISSRRNGKDGQRITMNAAIATILVNKFGAAAPAINANYERTYVGDRYYLTDTHGKPGNSAPPKEQPSLLARALMQRLK